MKDTNPRFSQATNELDTNKPFHRLPVVQYIQVGIKALKKTMPKKQERKQAQVVEELHVKFQVSYYSKGQGPIFVKVGREVQKT